MRLPQQKTVNQEGDLKERLHAKNKKFEYRKDAKRKKRVQKIRRKLIYSKRNKKV